MTPASEKLPSALVVLSGSEIEATFRPLRSVAPNVFLSEDYAIKVLHSSSSQLQNELYVMNKLNGMTRQTLIFGHAYGYILSPDSPLHFQDDSDDEWIQTRGHYAYLFMEPFESNFCDLPDEPKTNEDFFFEILIGLYYARKEFSFCHWDIHRGQLMFNTLEEEEARCYRIGGDNDEDNDGFYVTITSSIEPKLVDFGKSVIEETGITTEDLMMEGGSAWKDHHTLWNKSDIYHLALIFSHRENLSPTFRLFLEETVLPMYRSSMYATRPQKDSSTNYTNIQDLLRLYFCAQQNETTDQ